MRSFPARYRIGSAPPSPGSSFTVGNHMDRTVGRADETALRSRMRSQPGAGAEEGAVRRKKAVVVCRGGAASPGRGRRDDRTVRSGRA